MTAPLKQRLRDGSPLVGCFVMLPSPALVEMVGHSGFDFVVLDSEHGPMGTEMLEHQLRAADSAGVPALVRTVGMTAGEILRALDAGATGILVPHVITAEEAAAIGRAAHYPPHGNRGMAITARAGRYGFTTADAHLDRALRETTVIVQIEDREALPHAGAIARVEGIDAVFVGPADLAMSLGRPGDLKHADVLDAMSLVVAECRAAGRAAASFARTPADVQACRDRGFTTVIMSTASMLTSTLQDVARQLRPASA